MRAKIEKWVLIVVLAYGYLVQIPGLWRQGSIGIPALVIGGVIFFVLIALLMRASAGAALLIGMLGSLSATAQVIVLFLGGPIIRGVERPSFSRIALGIGGAMVVAYLGIDLWSQWRNGRTSR
jgi:hypothetical protein